MRVHTLVVGLAAVTLVASTARSQEQKPTYHKDLPATLVKEAKVSEPEAAAAALKAVPNGKIQKMELEKEDGKFIYSYDLKVAGKSGVEEVHIDAMTGAVVSNVHETPAQLKAEQAKEAAAKKDAKKAAAKKP